MADMLPYAPLLGVNDFRKKIDKPALLRSYILYFMARLQTMFKYEGLPDTIPAQWLEHYMMNNGHCIIGKYNDDLYTFFGGWGGEPDAYYVPTTYIVANPYLKHYKTYEIDKDCVLFKNDTYAQGLIPLLNRYCSMMVENDITMNIADIMARATITISAADDNTKASATEWLNQLVNGKLGVIGESAFLDGLKINSFESAAHTLTDLIETQQYLKASLYNEIGLNANWNAKREAIGSNESALNDDMLTPLIDNMLALRQEAVDKVNKMFGTNITVSFNGAWEENEIEVEAALEMVENQAEAVDQEEMNDEPADEPEEEEPKDE